MVVVLLSRLQFARTVMFHYLFPPVTIGLGAVLVFLEYRWLRTGDAICHQAAGFWTKVFGINFALGSIFWSLWIVVANSWQQTPAGSHLVGRTVHGRTFVRAEIVDFRGMVFNPSSMPRLSHVLLHAFVAGAFFAMSISAWYLLRGRHIEFAKRSFTGALLLATAASFGAGPAARSCDIQPLARKQPDDLQRRLQPEDAVDHAGGRHDRNAVWARPYVYDLLGLPRSSGNVAASQDLPNACLVCR